MSRYTTKTKVATFLNTAISDDIDSLISAAEKYIDIETGRNFKADTEAVAREYDGNNIQGLVIDDCISITKVELGNDQYGDAFTEQTLNTDYKLLPNNYSDLDLPIRKIWLRSQVWGVGVQNHRITAKWGYSEEAPDDIAWVATFLAASIYQMGQGGNVGGVKSEKIGGYSVAFSTGSELSDFKKMEEILKSYKKYVL